MSYVRSKPIVRAFCVYDFLGLGLFAFPILNTHQIATYSFFNQLLGGDEITQPDPFGLLGISLLGVLVIAWGIWRWQDSTPHIAAFEGTIRFAYGPIMLWFGTQFDMPLMTLAGVADVIIGVVHFVAARRDGWRYSLWIPQTIS